MDLLCFEEIILEDPIIRDKRIAAKVTLVLKNSRHAFDIEFSYPGGSSIANAQLYRLAAAMPLLNYGLFTRRIIMNFPITKSDLELLNDLNRVFSQDILVNKLARRRTNYVLDKYLKGIDQISPRNLPDIARLVPSDITEDSVLGRVEPESCGILSSGGKESLLTYGMLKEIGAESHPFYVNESGGHWRTALPAYRHHSAQDAKTSRVWTNVDRLYTFMLDHMKIIRRDHRRVRADTYPIRLCIFPVYVMALLPVFIQRGIGNLLIGSEFDDQRTVPEFNGIRHYYGVYDQTADFDQRMEQWYASRIPGMRQWSAVRPVSGLIVERILVKRYPDLAANQRSCHSCHFEGDEIVPCGKCTKCLGVMLFLRANGFDPGKMNFRQASILDLGKNLVKTPLRLDPDEYQHSLFLAGLDGQENSHAESVHICEATDISLIPDQFRGSLMKIIEEHTNGTTELRDGQWVLR